MKKNLIKVFTLLTIVWLLWALVKYTSQAFAKKSEFIDLSSIVNTWCIEFMTADWSVQKCDDVEIYYADQVYPVQKWQKTGGMSNFTTWDIEVTSGEYILYKIDFVNISDDLVITRGQVKDYLPNCVNFITGSIHGVDWAVFGSSTNNKQVWFRDFRLNPGQSWYMLVTGQVTTAGTTCASTTEYLNTWSFKSLSPNWTELFSTVLAIRKGDWPTPPSNKIVFNKTWNRYEWHPGETWLEFTLTVKNTWTETINNVQIEDIWPDNGSCIEFSWWSSDNLDWVSAYKWKYSENWWNLPAWEAITLKIYANIADNPNCVWAYINTWKLTYEWWEKFGTYKFIVVTDRPNEKDIQITKTANRRFVKSGDTVVYTIRYENTSNKPLVNYTITDSWPSELIFVNAIPQETSSGWNTITWEGLPTLEAHWTNTITINAIVR